MVAGGHPVRGRCGFGSHIITNTTTATRLCQPYHHHHRNQWIFQVTRSSPKIQCGLFWQLYVSCKVTLAVTTSSSDGNNWYSAVESAQEESTCTIADKGLTVFWQCSCTTPRHHREERQTGGVWKKSGISSESERSHCDQRPDFFQRSFQAQCSFNPSNLDRSCHCRRPIHSLFVTALVRFSSTQCTSSKKKFPCHVSTYFKSLLF